MSSENDLLCCHYQDIMCNCTPTLPWLQLSIERRQADLVSANIENVWQSDAFHHHRARLFSILNQNQRSKCFKKSLIGWTDCFNQSCVFQFIVIRVTLQPLLQPIKSRTFLRNKFILIFFWILVFLGAFDSLRSNCVICSWE